LFWTDRIKHVAAAATEFQSASTVRQSE
jgi:hypothetical protein